MGVVCVSMRSLMYSSCCSLTHSLTHLYVYIDRHLALGLKPSPLSVCSVSLTHNICRQLWGLYIQISSVRIKNESLMICMFVLVSNDSPVGYTVACSCQQYVYSL